MDISDHLRRALTKYYGLSREEQEAMHEAQRRSWLRGITAKCEHGIADFEQCPKCRSANRGHQ